MKPASVSRINSRARAARKQAQRRTLDRSAIWPRRTRPCLAAGMFAFALAQSHRDVASPSPEAEAKPDGLAGAIAAAVRLCAAVGLPELWTRPADAAAKVETKAPTLIEIDETPRGLVIRLIHRVAHSRHRLEAAADALSDILAAMGREVRFREVGHAPKLGGWQASLRVSPAIARTGPAMVR